MKKILLCPLLILFFPLVLSAQLKDGKYSIVGYRTLIDGKTSVAELVTDKTAVLSFHRDIDVINIVFGNYTVFSFAIKSENTIDGKTIYDCTELKSNTSCTLIYVPDSDLIEGGLLGYIRSSQCTDFFVISKQVSTTE